MNKGKKSTGKTMSQTFSAVQIMKKKQIRKDSDSCPLTHMLHMRFMFDIFWFETADSRESPWPCYLTVCSLVLLTKYQHVKDALNSQWILGTWTVSLFFSWKNKRTCQLKVYMTWVLLFSSTGAENIHTKWKLCVVSSREGSLLDTDFVQELFPKNCQDQTFPRTHLWSWWAIVCPNKNVRKISSLNCKCYSANKKMQSVTKQAESHQTKPQQSQFYQILVRCTFIAQTNSCDHKNPENEIPKIKLMNGKFSTE